MVFRLAVLFQHSNCVSQDRSKISVNPLSTNDIDISTRGVQPPVIMFTEAWQCDCFWSLLLQYEYDMTVMMAGMAMKASLVSNVKARMRM